MPAAVRVARWEAFKPLVVLKETITVPTLALSAKPVNLEVKEGPSVAEEAELAAHIRSTTTAEIDAMFRTCPHPRVGCSEKKRVAVATQGKDTVSPLP